MKRRGPPVYAPELVGINSRQIVERELLKIQEVVDQSALHFSSNMDRLDSLESGLSKAADESAQSDAAIILRIEQLESGFSDASSGAEEQMKVVNERLSALENSMKDVSGEFAAVWEYFKEIEERLDALESAGPTPPEENK